MSTGILIIAEAGVNHNGDLETAKKLISAAAKAGANAVKFQTYRTEELVTSSAAKAEYQSERTGSSSQFEMLKSLELSQEQHRVLKQTAADEGLLFCSTAFDLPSIDFLAELGIPFWKIPSGEITNLPYLRKIAFRPEKKIISTGMASLDEVRDCVEVFDKTEDITLLHCTTQYPAPIDQVNLRAMAALRQAFGCSVGYSDHTEGIEIAIAAAALGAEVIEKHFTLDKTMIGPDHAASLEPIELMHMVLGIRKVESALGNGTKLPMQAESGNKAVARKSIVARTAISRGEQFTDANITVKRPGTGISPMKWDDVIGKISKRDFLSDELIEL